MSRHVSLQDWSASVSQILQVGIEQEDSAEQQCHQTTSWSATELQPCVFGPLILNISNLMQASIETMHMNPITIY